MRDPAKKEPPDQWARHRITEVLDANFLVEAGAGSGKTTSLVDRMVALVRLGVCKVDEIAAVTFHPEGGGGAAAALPGRAGAGGPTGPRRVPADEYRGRAAEPGRGVSGDDPLLLREAAARAAPGGGAGPGLPGALGDRGGSPSADVLARLPGAAGRRRRPAAARAGEAGAPARAARKAVREAGGEPPTWTSAQRPSRPPTKGESQRCGRTWTRSWTGPKSCSPARNRRKGGTDSPRKCARCSICAGRSAGTTASPSSAPWPSCTTPRPGRRIIGGPPTPTEGFRPSGWGRRFMSSASRRVRPDGWSRIGGPTDTPSPSPSPRAPPTPLPGNARSWDC